MARKSSKSVKLSKKFGFNFEVVLIIVLIIVAIVLICFLNRKYRGVEGFESPAELAARIEKKRIHFFFAKWCKHSTDYINAESDGLKALEKALGDAGLTAADVLIKYDVGADDDVKKKAATEAAEAAKVTKLPAFYVVTDATVDPKYVGDYDQFKDITVGADLNGKLVTWLNK